MATTTGKGQNSGRKSKKLALNKRALPDLTLGKNKADGVRGGGLNCAKGEHYKVVTISG
jgi:hypothetical protein